MSSCHCNGCDGQFGSDHAANDLKRYRESGPDRTTQILLDALKREPLQHATLLDIGAGIGVIHHELLSAGARSATHVDATEANIEAARQETARKGHVGSVEFVQGDFVELASEIPAADVVTLDRVICCYPNMEQLVSASAAKARRLYGAVYPRDAWLNKAWVAVENLARRILGNPFRTFVHPVTAIDDILARNGFNRRSARDTFVWRVAVYTRD